MVISATVKVNNSSSFPVRITDNYPVISWTFDELNLFTRSFTDPVYEDNVYDVPSGELGPYSTHWVDQKGFDLRISTGQSGWGTGSFVGDILHDGFVESTLRQYIYNKPRLTRGSTYYGQVQITDLVDDTSAWITFSFQFNRLPHAIKPVINPSPASVTDDLVLSYTFTDPDGDPEQGTEIRWFKDGLYMRQYDNQTQIESLSLAYGESWSADILPSDGYEFGARAATTAVLVTTTAPTVSDVMVLPKNPTENDILKAHYEIAADINDDQTLIRWFVNDVLVSSYNNQRYVRLNVSAGAKVRFELQPHDGVSYGDGIASPEVIIQSSEFVVHDLRIQGETEPLDIVTTRPVISWDIKSPAGLSPRYTSVKIGTFAGGSNLHSEILESSQTTFVFPPNIASRGGDYYVSISMSNNQVFSRYTIGHFRVIGSKWEGDVSNNAGWTIELAMLVDQSATYDASKFQFVRIEDGVKFGEIQIFADRLAFVSLDTETTEALDFTGVVNLTIVGQGSNVKIYLNRSLVLDATGDFAATSTSKKLQIGSISSSRLTIEYQSIFYTIAGAYYPDSSSLFNDIQFHVFADFPFEEASAVKGFLSSTTHYRVLAVNPDREGQGGSIYSIVPASAQQYSTVNRTFSPINRIRISADGLYAAVAHARGLAVLKSYYIGGDYNRSYDFTSQSRVLPDSDGWELVQNTGTTAAVFDDSGLLIDTSTENVGQWSENIT
jgi:hypothetical protein